MKVSRLARRMLRPVYEADGIAPLDIAGLPRDRVMEEIKRLGVAGLIRSTGNDPEKAMFVFTAGAREAFAPTWLDKVLRWLRTQTSKLTS